MELKIRRPDDFHLHLRDGDMLESVLPFTVQQFARAIVMPNLKPPVTSVALAREYQSRILKALGNADFKPLMTCYLCDNTPPEEIERGVKEGLFSAVKYYPVGATTHSDYGVTSIAKVSKVFELMQKLGVPLSIHGESINPAVDVFDREAAFIDEIMIPLLKDFPALKIVMEHISTEEAAQLVTGDTSGRLAATITPHHLMFNRNAIFAGGLRPHYYCLPILKGAKHQKAVRKVATSGSPLIFAGTDSAPHARPQKECDGGAGGVFNAPYAMEVYATVFEEEGALDKLEKFSSEFGARFYGLALNTGSITLKKETIKVPEEIALKGGNVVCPLLAGKEIGWKLVAEK